MKKLTITNEAKPASSEEERALTGALAGICACYQALMLGIRSNNPLTGLEETTAGNDQDILASQVFECNRMVAFVRFVAAGAWIEISFSKAKNLIRSITLWFVLENDSFICQYRKGGVI